MEVTGFCCTIRWQEVLASSNDRDTVYNTVDDGWINNSLLQIWDCFRYSYNLFGVTFPGKKNT